MRERASMASVGSIAKRPWEGPLATVGKPYKLPAGSTVWEDLLTPNRTLCGSRTRADSARDSLGLLVPNFRTRYDSASSARKGPHFLQLANLPPCVALSLPSLAGCMIAFRTTRWLVPTTFSRGKDDHHRDLFPFAGGEIYFWRSEFWTEEKRRRHSSVTPSQSTARPARSQTAGPNLSTWDHELPHLRKPQGCTSALRIRSGRRNRP